MSAEIINLNDQRRKRDPQIICVGDSVAWRDWDGMLYEGLVENISYKTLGEDTFETSKDCFPMWEKDEYVVDLGKGFSVLGCALVKKIVRKAGDKTQDLPRHSYGN